MRRIFFTACFFVLSILLVFTSKQGYATDLPKEIILGIPTDLGTSSGRDAYRAAMLAIEEINKQGGVKVAKSMLPFRVEAVNTRDASPGVPVTEALLAVEKLIFDKKINFIVVGSYRSEAILAQMDLVSRNKIPMLASIAGAPQYTQKIAEDPKYKYCFRVCIDAKGMVLGIVAGIMDLKEKFGFDTVYFIIQDVAAYRGVAKMTSQIIEKKGVKLLGYDRFPTGASQFASALTRVKETGAKIIMIDMDMPEGAILVKQIKAMKIPAVITGQVVELTGQEAWETYGEKIAGVINMYNQMANLPAKKWPKALSFHEAYQKRWGQGIETGHGPAPAYASIYILRDAIERAGSIDPDAVVKELEETDYVGLLGRTRFDKKSHQLIYGTDIHESAIIANAQWSEQGERVIVFPESVAEGKIALPPSLR